MCLTAPLNILDQETEGGEIEVCSIPTQQYSDPTLTGNSSTPAAECLVSAPDTTAEGTVLGGSKGVAVIMSEIQTIEVASEQEELELELALQEQPQIQPNLEDLHIDVVGVKATPNGTPEIGIKEVMVTKENKVDIHVGPVVREGNPRRPSLPNLAHTVTWVLKNLS